MKTIIATLVCAIGAVAIAYAAPKWVPTAYSGDQLIVSGRAVVVDANIYYTGVTAGDKLVLKNGTTSSGSAVYTFVAPAANGSYQWVPTSKDLVVDTGIYLDETKSGGIIGIELFYQ